MTTETFCRLAMPVRGIYLAFSALTTNSNFTAYKQRNSVTNLRLIITVAGTGLMPIYATMASFQITNAEEHITGRLSPD